MTRSAKFPTLDPELAAAVTMLPEVDHSDLPALRSMAETLMAPALAELSFDGVTVRELMVDGVDGAPAVGVRFFRPDAFTEHLPVLLWIHGGGFTTGRAVHDDPFCVGIARQLGIAVASVDYRLAPETTFPGPIDDCYAALTYIHQNADELGISASHIAVGGQSAGGGLAAGTVLRARDNAEVPVAFQFLDMPELDDRMGTESWVSLADAPLWNREYGVLSWQRYLGDTYSGPDDPDVSIYASPSRATDLSGLPPTYICTAELDPLRDEGIEYALRLLRAGVSVELHSFPGTFHASTLVAAAEVSKRAAAEALAALSKGLARPVNAS